MELPQKQEAEIQISLSEIIDVGGEVFFEGFLDLLVEKAYGLYAPASEIDYEIVRSVDKYTLLLKVAAFIEKGED
jgi:hypothetical protein